MPIFEENIHFKLPGLGSAEKDTPGSFREGTPFNKISGPSPEPEVSRELVDLKTQEEAVKQTSKTADAMEAMGKMARVEDAKAKQQFIDQIHQTMDETTSDKEKQQKFIDNLRGSTIGKQNALLGKTYARYGVDPKKIGFLSNKSLSNESLPKGIEQTPSMDKPIPQPLPNPKTGKVEEEESLIGNLISGVKKYGPTVANYIGTGGAGIIGKKIRDRFKGE